MAPLFYTCTMFRQQNFTYANIIMPAINLPKLCMHVQDVLHMHACMQSQQSLPFSYSLTLT